MSNLPLDLEIVWTLDDMMAEIAELPQTDSRERFTTRAALLKTEIVYEGGDNVHAKVRMVNLIDEFKEVKL